MAPIGTLHAPGMLPAAGPARPRGDALQRPGAPLLNGPPSYVNVPEWLAARIADRLGQELEGL